MSIHEIAVSGSHQGYTREAEDVETVRPAVARIFHELPDEGSLHTKMSAGNWLLRRWRVLDAGAAWASLMPTLKH